MIATVVIASILFVYAGIMILRSIKEVKQALKGEGCASCDMSCQNCQVITTIKFT